MCDCKEDESWFKRKHHRCDCCPEGPQGPQGVQGPAGVAGPAGSQGQQGVQGPQGPQGLQGVQGPKGDMGDQGPKGDKGDKGDAGAMGPKGDIGPQGPPGVCECPEAYTNVWSQVNQTQSAFSVGSDTVKFEGLNDTVGFDTSMANVTGAVTALVTGDYLISWHTSGHLSPPFPAPVPSWAYSLFVNDAFISGASGLGFTSSPNDELIATSGTVILALKAGDSIKLKNITTAPVDLVASISSLAFPGTSASLQIALIS